MDASTLSTVDARPEVRERPPRLWEHFDGRFPFLQPVGALIPEDARDWCAPQPTLRHGKPYREILAVAETEHVDLIVMGVHGRNALDVMLFGSTTNHVVRRASCPVLTLKK